MQEENKISIDEILKNVIWIKTQKAPFMQGWAINFLLKKYKIKAQKIGYSQMFIIIVTKNQMILWEDKGTKLVFIGIKDINRKELEKELDIFI